MRIPEVTVTPMGMYHHAHGLRTCKVLDVTSCDHTVTLSLKRNGCPGALVTLDLTQEQGRALHRYLKAWLYPESCCGEGGPL